GSVMAEHIQARKDVFYRLKNNTGICCRIILCMFGLKFIRSVAAKSDNDIDAPKCLIFDDSLLPKTGRYIEKIFRVFDHVSKRSIRSKS
ncbi:MAG: hypothetical protein JW801_13655, partial [Bacteroidales bacterium]|nr:hypothetical protein [Bacteroidales bacterium]